MFLRYLLCFFFFKVTATTTMYPYGHTLSLHAALPISASSQIGVPASRLDRRDVPTPVLNIDAAQLAEASRPNFIAALNDLPQFKASWSPQVTGSSFSARSEEHTSELQSLMRISYAVFCLKKKNISNTTT